MGFVCFVEAVYGLGRVHNRILIFGTGPQCIGDGLEHTDNKLMI